MIVLVFIGHLYFSFWGLLIQFVVIFINWVIWFLISFFSWCLLLIFLHLPSISIPSLMHSWQMGFSHPISCLFPVLMVSECSNFTEVHLSVLGIISCANGLSFFLQKTPCLCPGLSILHVFSPSRSFASYIKDFDPFWIGFYAGWAIAIGFHSSLCGNYGYKIFASWVQTLKLILICSRVERGFFPTRICFLE